MKKMIAILAAMLLILCAAALAEDAGVTGEWHLQRVDVQGVIALPGETSMDVTLNEDGTGVTSDGAAFTWALTEAGLTIEGADDIESASFENGVLSMESAIGTLYFGREAVQPMPGVAAAQSEEAFDGVWHVIGMNMGGLILPAEAVDVQDTITIADGTAVLTTPEGEDGEPMETHFDAMLSDGILILTDTAEEEQIMQYSFSLLEDGTALYRVSVEDFNVDMYYAKAE